MHSHTDRLLTARIHWLTFLFLPFLLSSDDADCNIIFWNWLSILYGVLILNRLDFNWYWPVENISVHRIYQCFRAETAFTRINMLTTLIKHSILTTYFIKCLTKRTSFEKVHSWSIQSLIWAKYPTDFETFITLQTRSFNQDMRCKQMVQNPAIFIAVHHRHG